MPKLTMLGALGLALLLSWTGPLPAGGATDATLSVERLPEEQPAPAGAAPTYVAHQSRADIRIDGDLSDWPELEPIVLAERSQSEGEWNGPEDLSAKAYWMWDETHLYFACDVRDDILESTGLNGSMWVGDAIQFAFDPRHDAAETTAADDYEFVIALTTEGPGAWRHVAPSGQVIGRLENIRLAVIRKPQGDGYIYEMALPWEELAPLVPLAMADCGLAMAVADNDGREYKGGLQWARGIWNTKRPASHGDLIFQPAPPVGDAIEVFIGAKNPVIRTARDARVIVAINAAQRARPLTITAQMLSADKTPIGRITRRVELESAVDRFAIVWPIDNRPTGEYFIKAAVLGVDSQPLKERTFAVFGLGDLFRPRDQQLESTTERIKARARAEDNAMLALRTIDIRIRRDRSRRQWNDAMTKTDADTAMAWMDEAEAVARSLVEAEPPDRSARHAAMRLAGDPDAQSVWETAVDEDNSSQIGLYYAGIPLAHLSSQGLGSEKAAQELQQRLKRAEEKGHVVTKQVERDFTVYAIKHANALKHMLMHAGADLYIAKTFNDQAGQILAARMALLAPVTADDIDAMRRAADYHRRVQVDQIGPILAFDFAQSAIVVGGSAEPEELALAHRLRRAFGGQVVSEAQLGAQQDLVAIGTGKTNPLIRRYEVDGHLSYHQPNQGVLTHRTVADKNVIIVAGTDTASVQAAGRSLRYLVTVLKDRQVLVGDLHAHSAVSDGVEPPMIVALATMRNYMDFATISDHNSTSGALAAIGGLHEEGVQHTILIGQEVTTPWAHLPVIGCRDIIKWGESPNQIIRTAHDNGGIVILAHPGFPDSDWTTRTLVNWTASGVDAFEARRNTMEHYPKWKEFQRLPAIVASTDSHHTTFTYPVRTIVFAKGDQPEQIIEAVRNGYCLGYSLDDVHGPDMLIDVFNCLREEGEYLKTQHQKRLTARARTLCSN